MNSGVGSLEVEVDGKHIDRVLSILVALSPARSLCLSPSLPPSLSFSPSVSLCLSVSLRLSLPPSLFQSRSVSLLLPPSLPLSVFQSRYVSRLLCIPPSLTPALGPTPSNPHPPLSFIHALSVSFILSVSLPLSLSPIFSHSPPPLSLSLFDVLSVAVFVIRDRLSKSRPGLYSLSLSLSLSLPPPFSFPLLAPPPPPPPRLSLFD